MIISFRCKHTESLAQGKRVKKFIHIERAALRKIRQLQSALILDDLKVPPGNKLERLQGDRKEFYSIRINRQFRLCFLWTLLGAEEVEITDYH